MVLKLLHLRAEGAIYYDGTARRCIADLRFLSDDSGGTAKTTKAADGSRLQNL